MFLYRSLQQTRNKVLFDSSEDWDLIHHSEEGNRFYRIEYQRNPWMELVVLKTAESFCEHQISRDIEG